MSPELAALTLALAAREREAPVLLVDDTDSTSLRPDELQQLSLGPGPAAPAHAKRLPRRPKESMAAMMARLGGRP